MKPHKHAEFIKAWADGAEIEYKDDGENWSKCKKPCWHLDVDYRIKPAAPKWPETTMSDEILVSSYFGGGPVPHDQEYAAWRRVANAALRHSIETGQLVTKQAYDREIEVRDKLIKALQNAVEVQFRRGNQNAIPYGQTRC